MSISVGVETGDVGDSGAAKLTWIRVAVFGDAAVKLAGAAKGSRIYVEGQLTQSTWNAADGEVRHGLNVAAWKGGEGWPGMPSAGNDRLGNGAKSTRDGLRTGNRLLSALDLPHENALASFAATISSKPAATGYRFEMRYNRSQNQQPEIGENGRVSITVFMRTAKRMGG